MLMRSHFGFLEQRLRRREVAQFDQRAAQQDWGDGVIRIQLDRAPTDFGGLVRSRRA